jgi:hypothetical protein
MARSNPLASHIISQALNLRSCQSKWRRTWGSDPRVLYQKGGIAFDPDHEPGEMKTVWVYVDTSKQVGDVDHLKIFKTSSPLKNG